MKRAAPDNLFCSNVDIDASEEIWAFFRRYSLPAGSC